MGVAGRIAWGLALLGVGAVLVGCGDDSSTADAQKERPFPNVKGPTREFLIPGGDNTVQLTGREATVAEREQASKVIHAWMRARAAEDWKADCSYLSRKFARLLTLDANRVTAGKVKTCPQALEYFGENASGDLVNNLDGPIVSLRARGKTGFAQYHGNDGEDWIVPMNEEAGKWLVATGTPIGRNE